MKRLDLKLAVLVLLTFTLTSWVVHNVNLAYVPTTLDDYFLLGSQPLESGTFASPNMCDNCHGGFDANTEAAFTWRGSMMAHSMRDPLFEASMVIANQDAQFSGDLCIRCHSPGGWLEGRSTPTDGSALNENDRQGVQCHVCHRMIDPLSTLDSDLTYINGLSSKPTMHGNGMYIIDSEDVRRGPYDNVQANHETLYSEFYTSSEMCATCHDVSNPVYTKQPDGRYLPNALGTPASSFNTYDMFPVERTYSEWKMSDYNSETGVYSEVFGGNLTNVISCQDCHMKEVTGRGVNKNYAPIRTDLGQHDLMGGNTFVPLLIKDKYSDDTNVDTQAIDAGILRARYMLQHAATLSLQAHLEEDDIAVGVKIINETGHKLPSGYPEGRRMWINLIAFDTDDTIIYESGAYNPDTGILEINEDTKVYEAKLGISQEVADIANANAIGSYIYSAGESFHFALNNEVVKDNRIPPRGFTNAKFESVQAAPVGYSYADGVYWDITTYEVPISSVRVVAKLYYQTVSKEYIEFLKNFNETNTLGDELYTLWEAHGKSLPELMQEETIIVEGLRTSEVLALESQLKLYPNPASGVVNISFPTIELSNVDLSLYNMSGQLIKSFKPTEYLLSKSDNIQLPILGYAKGIYFIKLKYKGIQVTKLLVIK